MYEVLFKNLVKWVFMGLASVKHCITPVLPLPPFYTLEVGV